MPINFNNLEVNNWNFHNRVNFSWYFKQFKPKEG